MENRSVRWIGLAILIVLGFIALRPYVEDRLYSATTPRPVEPRGSLADYEKSTIEIFQRVSPSVVQVVGQVGGGNVFGQLGGEETGIQSGTGSVWDEAGHIVTNNHVVQGTNSLAVRFASGQTATATIVGTAPNYDLAVIRVTGVKLPPPIMVGESANLQVGQAVFAIGNPFGLDQTLTNGIVSALKRHLPTSNGRELSNVIQTDAPINPGNSGGPLLDSSGRMIGVNTAIVSPSGTSAGVGFAIPVDTVNRVVPELIKNGRVPTPGIGIVAASEAAATKLGVQGVIIVRTVPGSPAAKAGLRGIDAARGELGDVITGVDRKPVHQLSDLTQELEQVGIGKTVQIEINRGGSDMTVSLQVADISQARG
ncbi:MAG TPA: trypsin-like peptidase domain-containing protein [Xanthobacteraceae bacterium]|jgi:2-alkenal reductase